MVQNDTQYKEKRIMTIEMKEMNRNSSFGENNNEILNVNNIDEAEKEDLIEKSKSTNQVKFPRGLKINYAVMCFFAFLTGIDFAVILPTLWDRLHLEFKASGSFMGVVISSYMFSGVICGLIMGPISDKINQTKIFYLIGTFLTMIGQFLYFLGINKFFILASRLISGCVGGAVPVAFAYIAKTTSDKQRLTIMAILMASRQLGLMLGPAFNLFLRKTDFVFIGFTVNRWSSPGMLMGILWLSCFLAMLIFYHDDSKHSYRLNKPIEKTNFTSKDYKNEFFRFEMFVLLLITFFTYFNQTSLETIVIPFTEIMFGWNELQNSILFCIAGATIIISFIFIKLLEKKLKERTIMLIGLCSIITGLIIGCSCLPFAKQLQDPSKYQLSLYKMKHRTNQSSIYEPTNLINERINNISINNSLDNTNITNNSIHIDKIFLNQNRTYDYQFFPAFVFFVILDVLGLPAIAITSSSLFSKLTDNKLQGFGQGIQRGILGVGTIFGPLCTGPFVQKPIYLLACTLSFIILIFILFILSFKRLNPDLKSNSKIVNNNQTIQ
jgi:ceroid-lipofuscinosis MFS transporter 7